MKPELFLDMILHQFLPIGWGGLVMSSSAHMANIHLFCVTFISGASLTYAHVNTLFSKA